MSGRGRFGNGSGRGSGRGRGRGQRNNNRNNNKSNGKKSTNSNSKEMEFTPFYASDKNHGPTYDTVKDHIVNLVQKNYKFGNDLSRRLDEEKDYENKEEFVKVLKITLPERVAPAKEGGQPDEYALMEYKEALREQSER